MAHVILGLLMLRSMSQYDLMKAFERTISLFYSASPGSIRRALTSLHADGAIRPADDEGAGRGRKPWAITDRGRTRFRSWLLADVSDATEKDLLARLYFLGLLPPAERPAVLTRVADELERQRDRLRRLADAPTEEAVPEDLREVARFQRAALDLGLAQADQAIASVRTLAAAAAQAGPPTR